MEPEIVFRMAGEGNGICIFKIQKENNVKFLYSHNEFDPIADVRLVSKTKEYDNFDEPFYIILEKYEWFFFILKDCSRRLQKNSCR